MTQEQHPITPPPELVQQWYHNWRQLNREKLTDFPEYIATQAANWGADQELEACCEYIGDEGKWFANPEHRLAELRDARRPKPPSLKELALEDFNGLMSELDGAGNYSNCAERIRRALEALPDD